MYFCTISFWAGPRNQPILLVSKMIHTATNKKELKKQLLQYNMIQSVVSLTIGYFSAFIWQSLFGWVNMSVLVPMISDWQPQSLRMTG